jgi:hypothetical protein
LVEVSFRCLRCLLWVAKTRSDTFSGRYTSSGKAQERVIVLVRRWLAIARQPNIVQSQFRSVLPKGRHNVDEADARLVGSDNRLLHLALGFELLKSALYRG